MPALVVPIAGNPASSKMRALATSHALGSKSRCFRSWSLRNRSAFGFREGGRSMGGLPFQERHRPVVEVREVGGGRAVERIADARMGELVGLDVGPVVRRGHPRLED